MPSTPDWDLLSGSAVNAEGNQLILNVQLSTASLFDDMDEVDVIATTASARANLDKIGDIDGWRFVTQTGKVISTGSSGMIDSAGISDVGKPFYDSGSGKYVLAFKYRIDLTDAGRIAINNAATAVFIDGLAAGWLTVNWKTGSPSAMTGPSVSSSDPNLTFSPAAVGKLPSGNLKLHLDVQAQYVKEGTAKTHLTTWHDISGTGNNLTGGPSSDEPPLSVSSDIPTIPFTGSTPQRFVSGLLTTPVITAPATIAGVFKPNSPSGTSIIAGRFNASGLAWRLGFVASGADAVYQSSTGAGLPASYQVDAPDETVFAIVRRVAAATDGATFWINGRPEGSGTVTATVATGSGLLTVGARQTTTTPTWGDGFTGDIGQVALYDTDIDDLALSLVMHQMADRAGIDLGTPIPTAWRQQPYVMTGGVATPSPKRLDRRPIAVIRLAAGQFNSNMFGQSPNWRDTSESDIVAYYSAAIRGAIYGCDQFEIMFSRAGGQYSRDPVMTYVFGEVEDPMDPPNTIPIITETQWDAMRTLWTTFNLGADNSDWLKNAGHYPRRRGWFYTGGGLPLNDDGTLNETGHMGSRQVGPATPEAYLENVLKWWSGEKDADIGDDRFRCLFLDAASKFYGKFVEMVHSPDINPYYVLVAEAIPTDLEARAGAPWYSNVEFNKAPWWKIVSGEPNKKVGGYNPKWSAEWAAMPTYFGVMRGDGPDLYKTGSNPGEGNNLKLGNIYKWYRKGGVPVSWDQESHIKVGTAWNYATGRVMPSRLVRCPRLLRRARV